MWSGFLNQLLHGSFTSQISPLIASDVRVVSRAANSVSGDIEATCATSIHCIWRPPSVAVVETIEVVSTYKPYFSVEIRSTPAFTVDFSNKISYLG